LAVVVVWILCGRPFPVGIHPIPLPSFLIIFLVAHPWEKGGQMKANKKQYIGHLDATTTKNITFRFQGRTMGFTQHSQT
jgi:hypothetical protein